jgi:hypothetical protein
LIDPKYDIVLQIENATGGFDCKGFRGVPAARRSLIAMVSSGAPAGRAHVGELASELETVLRASSPQVACDDIACPSAPDQMNPADYPDRLKLLVLVGSAGAVFRDLAWYGQWDSDKHQAFVMPVLPPGRFEDQFEQAILADDKHLLRRINAARWNQKIAEALPFVLSRADVTSSASRVFVSYRRVESLPVALQLFDQLVKEGFDVFLDRFSIPFGFDFQRRLTQELEDKSMVILLESKYLKRSKWTQHEIDFAKRRRLGLIALRMPEVAGDELLSSIAYDARESLERSDFVKDPTKVLDPDGQDMVDQWPELNKEAVARVVTRIKSAHADALFRRRRRLRGDVVAALRGAGVDVEYSEVGPLFAGPDGHVVWLTTRPPEVDDFRSVDGARLARKSEDREPRGIIVGPMAALEPDRQERLKWLHGVSRCHSFDEGNLPEFVRDLASPTAGPTAGSGP